MVRTGFIKDVLKSWSLKLILLCALFGLLFSFAPHPLHLSVAEANWKKENKSLEVSLKLFFDDFEKALSAENNRPIFLCPDSTTEHQNIINNYFNKNLQLTVNQKTKHYNIIGYECENELVYVYLEYQDIGKIKSIILRNTLLFDTYLDQTNLFNLHVDGTDKTLLNQPKSPVVELELH